MQRFVRTRLVFLGAALTLLLAACTSGGDAGAPAPTETPAASQTTATEAAPETSGELTQLTFQLNWVPGGFNAGFAAARELGYYEEEGLFVAIVPGNGSGTTAQLAAAGNANLAYADSVATTNLIARDAPMKVISTLYQSAPAQLTALVDSGIDNISDFEGKTIAYATGAAEAPMLPLLWEANDIDPDSLELVGSPRESLVPQLLEGQVDAIVGSSDFYSIQLADRGAETVDFPFYEYGVATVSTSIFANTAWLEQNPEVTKSFVRASLRGWELALNDPQAAIDALVALFPDTDPEQALKELEATIPLFCANEAEYVGKATEEAWQRHQDVLSAVGTLPPDVDPALYYTYDYLPPDDELTPCPLSGN